MPPTRMSRISLGQGYFLPTQFKLISLDFNGDLNCAMDLILDKSCSKQNKPPKMAKGLTMNIGQVGCWDPLCFLYLQKKMSSHIDTLLTDPLNPCC